MANHEIETDPWVDQRLTAFLLDDTWQPDAWQPNETKALAALRERCRTRQSRRKQWWLGLPLATSLAGLAMFLIPASRACAQNPASCAERFWATILLRRAAPTDFKQAGSPSAPITAEIYMDYECPPCAVFFNDVLPQIESEYVQTGKLRLIFRDLPIPVHPHARLAARYANAAGQLGYYAIASKQLFRTQKVWSRTGDIESQLAAVLPPAIMTEVKTLVSTETTLPEDLASAQQDHINRTPSLVIVFQGKRQLLPAGDHSFASIKDYLESLTPR